MAKIATYPVVTPTTDDLLIGTNGSDGKTKNFTVGSVVGLAEASGTAAGLIATHNADTTDVHGIADTSALVLTNDARLSDSRTPTAHATTHASAGSDPLTLDESQITGLVSDLAAKATNAALSSHTSNTSNPHSVTAAQVGALTQAGADLLYSALGHTHAYSSLSGIPSTFAPSAHASTHHSGGSDALALGSIAGTIDDTQHGSRAGGSLHAVAVAAGAAGFMTGADKTKLDGIASGATANTGTVTSVGITAPADLSVSGSPVTSSGTLALSWANQAINTVLSGPSSGSSAAPSFRALVANDIPSQLNASSTRAALGTNADGLYVPWITGDTHTTLVVGSSSSSNAIQALNAFSGSGTAIVGQSGTGIAINAVRSTTNTNTAVTPLNVTHRSSGSIAASFGANIRIQLQSSTSADQDAGQMTALWTDATHVSRTSVLTFSTVNNASVFTEQARLTGAGAMLHRSTDATQAAGLYVPWISGDALPAIRAGSTNSSNNQIGIRGGTYSAQGVYGEANTGIGTFGTSVSGPGVQGQTTSGIGIYGIAGASGTAIQGLHSANLTNSVANMVVLNHRTSGTPAAGLGSALKFALQSTTTNDQDAGLITATWVDPTHASRKARVAFSVYDTASREGLRIEASGSAPMIGFLGASAVVRQTISAAASDAATTQALANSLRTAMINLGLGA
jgi:hypothetical protein